MKMLAAAAFAAFLLIGVNMHAQAEDARIGEAQVKLEVLAANQGATYHELTGVAAKGFIAFEAAQSQTALEGDTVIIFRHKSRPDIAFVVILKNGCFVAKALRPDAEIKHAEGADA
jgi:hypothetical protein